MRWHAKKIDANQPAIVRSLRAIHCSVMSLASLGFGTPDLCVARAKRTVLMEIKNEDGKDDLKNVAQSEFAAKWRGEIYTVHTPEEAVKIMLKWPS